MNKKYVQKYCIPGLKSIGYIAWVGVALFGFGYIVLSFAIQYLTPSAFQTWLSSPLGTLVGYVLTFAVTVAVLIGPYMYVKKLSWQQVLAKLGLKKPFRLEMLAWAFFAWGLFFVASIVISAFIATLFPGVNMSESQDVGFNGVSTTSGVITAFITLVVLAPLLEEIVFRGFLYGRLRENTGVVVSSILTSLAFAVAHMQLNVGIVVFVLSLFMCYLRERFDSIWPTILLHALKNGLAFLLIFVLHVST